MHRIKRITIGILAHVDAGKTTLSEALLFKTGELRRLGRVDHKDAFLDDSDIERNRGITIFSRQARFRVPSEVPAEVTLIDTPGHMDFSAEMERAMSVIDYGLLVVSGSEGIQTHTRTLFRMLRERQIPVIVFVNKMDIAVRKPADIISSLVKELDAGAVDFSQSEMSEEFIDAVTLCSSDLADIVLEGGELTDSDLAEAVLNGEIIPCVFGSALKTEGVDRLIEVLGRYTVQPAFGAEPAGRIYKISNTEDGEKLCFVKVTGGEIRVRDKVSGSSSAGEKWEAKINQIRLYSGSRYIQTDSAPAGTVCGITGFREASAGDSLGEEESFELQTVRPFIVSTVIIPEDRDSFSVMKDISALAEEDPALNIRRDPETGEIGIRFMGQIQPEVLAGMIKERFGYDVSFGSGNILYLETVSGKYEGVGHFEPLRHYAEVHITVEPGERGSGVVITSDVSEDELAGNWQRLILSQLEEAEPVGVLTGSPLTDVKITLCSGRAHEKHTVGGDFREAACRAVRHALMQARAEGRALLLEPWQDFEIRLPSRLVGRAMTDIRQMGGIQDGLEQDGELSVLKGRAPAAGLGGYQVILSGYSSGEGVLSCTQAGYEICHDAAAVIEAAAYEPQRDTNNPADSVFVNHNGSDIVSWEDVFEHMHLPRVLRRSGTEHEPEAPVGNMPDRRKAAQRASDEKELKLIFERTYGSRKPAVRHSAIERAYGGANVQSGSRDDERNREISDRHRRRKPVEIQGPPLIIIDGYNVIFADPHMTELAHLDVGAARQQLIERVSNYAAYTGADISVIFDAYRVPFGAGSDEKQLGIRVIYTGENETADIRMGMMINTARDRTVYAVSSDSLVQQDAFVHDALRLSSREFLKRLTETEEIIRTQLDS